MRRIFDDTMIERIQKIKLKSNKEFEAVFLSRIFGGNIVELICYGAGLLRVGFRNFLSGSILSHIIEGIPFFYFTSSIFNGEGVVLSLVSLGILFLLWFFGRKRYLYEL